MIVQTNLKLQITVNWIINKSKGSISWLTSTCCIIPIFPSVCHVYLLSTLFSSFLTVLLSVCVLFLSGGASVLLSLGFTSWCDTVTNQNMQPFRYMMSITCVHCWRFAASGFSQANISTADPDRWWRGWLTIAFSSFSCWFCTQLCRVPVYASVSGRGHLVFLHGAQPGTGRAAQNERFDIFKLADMQDQTYKPMVFCLPELIFLSAFTET